MIHKQDIINKASLTNTPLQTLQNSVNQKITDINLNDKNYDVIVVGVGSMGAATCYYLAKQGLKVLGLEQFDIPNQLSSHTGQSRLIRKAYFEHPDYVPLLEKAYTNWRAIEEESNTQLYYQTGLLYLSDADNMLIQGVKESAKQYDIQLDQLSSKKMKDQYPQFKIPDHYERLFESEAGFITPERAILVYAIKP